MNNPDCLDYEEITGDSIFNLTVMLEDDVPDGKNITYSIGAAFLLRQYDALFPPSIM